MAKWPLARNVSVSGRPLAASVGVPPQREIVCQRVQWMPWFTRASVRNDFIM